MSALLRENTVQNVIECWKQIAPVVHEPETSDDYDRLSGLLDKLLDMVGDNESHEMMGLVDVISHMIAMYDECCDYQFDNASSIDALNYLMEQHNLKQADLSDIGSQGVVSEILNGKRALNLNQIKQLSKRFHVSPNTFID